MAITVEGAGSAAATTVSIPTHAVGDMLVIMARGTAAPTIPAAGGTVPTWTVIGTAGANNSVGWTVARAVATATTHTSGTWTGAAQLHVLVLRAGTGSISIGNAPAATGANNTQTIIYPALNVTAGQTANLAVRCGARGVADTEVETDGGFTTGGTFRTAQPASPNQTSAVFTKPITANEGSFTATPAGSNAAYRAVSFEIIEPPVIVSVSAVTGDPATFAGPLISVALTATAASGLATFGGGVATYAEGSSLDLTAVTGDPATFGGGDASYFGGLGLTVDSGLATFSGPLVAVLLTATASNGLATFGGGTATYSAGAESLDLTAGGGVATFSGPPIAVILAVTVSGGAATFGGGSVTGPPLSASGGAATFGGPGVSVELALDEGSGAATFGGGTATSSGGIALIPPVTEPSLGGSFDETGTGGLFDEAASGGMPNEPVRTGVVEDGYRAGTVSEQVRGGIVRPVVRSGVVVEPVRGGVFDQASTGGEVL